MRAGLAQRWWTPIGAALLVHIGLGLMPLRMRAQARTSALVPSDLKVRWASTPAPTSVLPASEAPVRPAQKNNRPKVAASPVTPRRPRKVRKKQARRKKRASILSRSKDVSQTTADEDKDAEVQDTALIAQESNPPTQSVSSSAQPEVSLEGYWQGFRRFVASYKKYPRMARRLRLEGIVKVQVTVDRLGRVLGAPKVVGSSGHAVLDAEALRMLDSLINSGFSVPLPTKWHKSTASVILPIEFQLRS
ncbi:MAG: TonB family protein [Myxococcales bacterium]|nr:TonB family protein [Myxococcales bacterium]